MYHHLQIKKVLQELNTQPQGLSETEATLRLEKHGANKLPEEKLLSSLSLFLHQFKNPLIYILFAALIISAITGHAVDAWIVGVVIAVSSTVGFLQEYKADRALSRLKQMVRHKARVMRNGKETIVVLEKIVPGDIITLAPGNKVPADARLIETHDFEVIEAALTGESIPSQKNTNVIPENTPLADRENMVYLGTIVARGRARAIVTATGQTTELGRIAALVQETKAIRTPLQRELNRFGKIISFMLIILTVFIFGLGLLAGRPLFEMFLVSVAIVVAAVPESLIPAMTVILAIGMYRLAKKQGLVRRMLAAETLGSVTVICADKTGTLTQGEMRVSEIITETVDCTNRRTHTSHTLQQDGETDHVLALKIGLLCNNAIIENPERELKDWIVIGDPTEKALLLAARSAGLKRERLEQEEPRTAEVPFDSQYKFMATLHKHEKGYAIYAKGAPEKLLAISSSVNIGGRTIVLTEARRKAIRKQHEKLTGSGLRVLAAAYKLENRNGKVSEFAREDVHDLVFVGLVALKDPLRPEAKKAITLSQNASIRPIIITGDHKLTAMAIVQELGIQVNQENVMEGSVIDDLSDEKLRKAVKRVVIFARVEPKHKIQIVSALQANGEVVAMIGDGVNDAPALKRADIGVAVGSGTDVVKEVADLVLLDNNFQTMVEAVRRGRITFRNIQKVALYLLTDSFSEIVIVGGSVLAGLPLPILPAQILWVKLIEDAAPAMSLSFEEVDEGVMEERPRKRTEPILNRSARKLILFYAIIMDITLFGLFYYTWKTSGDLDYARTITFVGLGITSLFYIYAIRGLKRSILTLNPFSNKFLVTSTIIGVILFLIAIYIPFFNNILYTVPLGINDWLILAAYVIMSIVVYEIGKKFTIAKTIGGKNPGFRT